MMPVLLWFNCKGLLIAGYSNTTREPSVDLKKNFFFVGVWVCGLGGSEGGLHGFLRHSLLAYCYLTLPPPICNYAIHH